MQTEIELESGQSFAIGGLLDRRLTETVQKIPLLSSIPLLGKLFQSKSLNKQNTELLVIVTPEIVRPIPQGQAVPHLQNPVPLIGPDSRAANARIKCHRTGTAGHADPVDPARAAARKSESAKRHEAGRQSHRLAGRVGSAVTGCS